MHRCLLIEDVVTHIALSTFDQYYPSSESRRTILNMALTCRAFFGPAMDILWSEIPNLVPLIKCMPPDLWQVSGTWYWGDSRPEDTILSLRRALLVTDWERFSIYAPRVRSFGFTDQLHYNICIADQAVCAEAFRDISLCKPTEQLLPNLRHLGWSDKDQLLAPYVHLFLGPKLHSLNLDLHDEDHTKVSSMLSYASFKCPYLTHVELAYKLDKSNDVQDISKFITGLAHLVKLDIKIPSLSAESIIHLSNLDCLEALLMRVPNLGDADLHAAKHFHPAHDSSVGFPSLQHLNIVTTRLSSILSVCRLMRSTPAKSISFSFETATNDEVRSLIKILHDQCSHSLLETLCVRQKNPSSSTPIAPGISIVPLFAFRNLQSLYVQSISLALNDALVRDLAVSWPELVCLDIAADLNAAAHATLLTLASLQILAGHCPRLVQVQLHVDSRVLPDPLDGFVGEKVAILELRSSPISDADDVAGFLMEVFPNLYSIHASDPLAAVGGLPNRWQRVNDILANRFTN